MRNPRHVTRALTERYNEGRAVAASHSVNYITMVHSVFRSFSELVRDSLATGYCPTMRVDPDNYSWAEMVRAAEMERLADAFDRAMELAGSPTRAYRASFLGPIPRPTAAAA